MEKELAKKLVYKRLASLEFRDFILADLFYRGKFPKGDLDFIGQGGIIQDFEEDSFAYLIYNPLKREVKKKTNYILSKPFTVVGNDFIKTFMESQIQCLKDTVNELYKKGEAWWEFEADPTSPIKFKITLRKAQNIVPKYTNEEETHYDAVGYLWNSIVGDTTQRYVDFVDARGRYRFALSGVDAEDQQLGHVQNVEGESKNFKTLPFIRLTTDGLYQQIVHLAKMYSARYCQADRLLEDNADPVAVITNASDTDPEILRQDIKDYKLVKVEGTGGFTYASKSTEYSGIESFMKVIRSDIADLCGTVSRESELQYVTSGRALDRLYVDMDADAADMGFILRNALKAFLTFVESETGREYQQDFNIIFNTDKPTDEQQIISNINSSDSLLSRRTLLSQHPWVEDVDKELELIQSETSKTIPDVPKNPDTGSDPSTGNSDDPGLFEEDI